MSNHPGHVTLMIKNIKSKNQQKKILIGLYMYNKTPSPLDLYNTKKKKKEKSHWLTI